MWGCFCTASRAVGRGNAVHVDNADRLSPLVLAANIHLGDVDSLIAQGLADEADQARAVHDE